MWIRNSAGDLVNLANVVSIQKHGHLSYNPEKKGRTFKVLAYDHSEEGTTLIANGLTEKQADKLLDTIWNLTREDKMTVEEPVRTR